MPVGGAGAAVVGGAYLSSQASKSAAKASERGAEQSTAAQLQMYNQSREDLAPWRGTGANALKQLAALNGVPYSTSTASSGAQTADNFDSSAYIAAHPEVGDPNQWDPNTHSAFDHYQMYGRQQGFDFPYVNAPAKEGEYIAAGEPDYSAFYKSPDYKFTFDQGQRAVNSGLAARGLSNSGRAMKELTRYGQGAASTQLNNYRNQLAALAGVGQTATTNTAQLGAATAGNIGQSYQNAADARASGYLGQANAINNTINQGTGLYALSQLYNKAA